MKTHLHVGYSAVGLLLSPVLQSAGHRQEVLLQLLGRDGLWASFISGGLYRYISYPSSPPLQFQGESRAILLPGVDLAGSLRLRWPLRRRRRRETVESAPGCLY